MVKKQFCRIYRLRTSTASFTNKCTLHIFHTQLPPHIWCFFLFPDLQEGRLESLAFRSSAFIWSIYAFYHFSSTKPKAQQWTSLIKMCVVRRWGILIIVNISQMCSLQNHQSLPRISFPLRSTNISVDKWFLSITTLNWTFYKHIIILLLYVCQMQVVGI